MLNKPDMTNYVPKYDFRVLREKVTRLGGRFRSYCTKHELNMLDKRVRKLQGFNMTLLSLRNDIAGLKAENRALKNEMKAMRKRHDKLRKNYRDFLAQKKSKDLAPLIKEV